MDKDIITSHQAYQIPMKVKHLKCDLEGKPDGNRTIATGMPYAIELQFTNLQQHKFPINRFRNDSAYYSGIKSFNVNSNLDRTACI